MATTVHFPAELIRNRLILPMILVFLGMLPSAGFVASLSLTRSVHEAGASVFEPYSPPGRGGAEYSMVGSARFWSHTFALWAGAHEKCVGGGASDFVRKECEAFRIRKFASLAISLTPLWLAVLFFFWRMDTAKGFYRAAAKKIATQKGRGPIAIKEVDVGGTKWFNHFYGVRAVELKDGSKAWTFVQGPMPQVGSSVLLYDLGEWGNAKRTLALSYTPHLAVVRGG